MDIADPSNQFRNTTGCAPLSGGIFQSGPGPAGEHYGAAGDMGQIMGARSRR